MKKNELIYKLIIVSIIGTGISSIANQIIIIREFLTQFHGNEVTISVVIFFWLLLGGIGSLFSKLLKKGSLLIYCIILFILAILPLFQIILIRFVRDLILIHGASPDIYSIFLYIFFTISLYCILIGFVLPYSQKVINEMGYKLDTGILYLTDNIGDITGGAIFSFFLVYILKPFPIIALTSTPIILITLLLLFYQNRTFLFIFCLALSIIFYASSLNSSFEKRTLKTQYGNIVEYRESPYGRIVITKEDEQYTFWESGTPLYFQQYIARSEEKVHYPLCQLDHVENILLISGGLGRTIKEIEKYHPRCIEYVELDPFITKIGLRHGIIKRSSNLSIINTDGRYYIKHAKKKYDAIIIDLPEPDTFQINRFFTKEFFSIVKNRLIKGGIISISMEYSPNYLSNVRKEKISILYNTLISCFKNVILIPGESLYFIARDGTLHMNIPARLKERSIETLYIKSYFYGNVTPDRIRYIMSAIKKNERINTDFRPYLVSVMFKEWFEKYNTSPKFLFIVFGLICLLYLILIKKEEYVLFSTGFVLMGMEMLIIFTFQIIYGYIYLRIGAIITIFLFGLLPGSLMGIKTKGDLQKKLITSELVILGIIVIYLIGLFHLKEEVPIYAFFIYSLIISITCGFQFPLVARIIGENRSPAAGCFAADLIGASVGTILIGIIIIPYYGIKGAIYAMILLKIISTSFSIFLREI